MTLIELNSRKFILDNNNPSFIKENKIKNNETDNTQKKIIKKKIINKDFNNNIKKNININNNFGKINCPIIMNNI